MSRLTTAKAREFLSKATREWNGDVSPAGVPCLTGSVVDASEPSGKRHVVIAEFHGENDMHDLVLASNAALLAESLIAAEAERDDARLELGKARGKIGMMELANVTLSERVEELIEARDAAIARADALSAKIDAFGKLCDEYEAHFRSSPVRSHDREALQTKISDALTELRRDASIDLPIAETEALRG